MPTVLVAADQTLFAWGHVSIILDPQGIIAAKLPGGMSVSTTVVVKCNQWHSLELTVLASGMMTLDVKSMMTAKANIGVAKSSHTELGIAQMFPLSVTAPVRIAAGFGDAPCCFNGKIEAPEILVDGASIAKWDFAQSISSLSVKAHTGPDLLLRNAPTRGLRVTSGTQPNFAGDTNQTIMLQYCFTMMIFMILDGTEILNLWFPMICLPAYI